MNIINEARKLAKLNFNKPEEESMEDIKMGSGIGSTVGGLVGAGVGSLIPGIGTVVGSMIGSKMGEVSEKVVEKTMTIPSGPSTTMEQGKVGTDREGPNTLKDYSRQSAQALQLMTQRGLKQTPKPKGARG